MAHRRHPLVRPLFAVGRPLYRFAVRPVVRVLAPEVRFLVDRLERSSSSPPWPWRARGSTSSSSTSTVVYGSTALTPFDRELFDAGRHLRSDVAVDVAKVVTELGSFPTVAALLVVAVVVLVARAPAGGRRAARARVRAHRTWPWT